MNIQDLLAPDAVLSGLKVQGKKQLLQELAARASLLTRLPERRIFETLMERERLGTTGVGQGVAIPHGRLSDVKGIHGVFAKLDSPLDYDAVDNQPVLTPMAMRPMAPTSGGHATSATDRGVTTKASTPRGRAPVSTPIGNPTTSATARAAPASSAVFAKCVRTSSLTGRE